MHIRAGRRSKIQPRQEEGCQVGRDGWEGGGGGRGAETLKVYVSPKIYPGNCLGCLLGSAGHAHTCLIIAKGPISLYGVVAVKMIIIFRLLEVYKD